MRHALRVANGIRDGERSAFTLANRTTGPTATRSTTASMSRSKASSENDVTVRSESPRPRGSYCTSV